MTVPPNESRYQPQPGGAMPPRKTRSWVFFRIVLGLAGAALVIFPVASGNSYIFSVAGLIMFVAAIMLVTAKPRTTLQEKARELGAQVVVDGGHYRLPNSSSSAPVQLFVASDRIFALDGKFRLRLEIPAAEITSFLAFQEGKNWFLEVIWSTQAAEFFYRGASAGRLALAAEDAIRRIAPTGAPAVAQRRAASA